ncbi:unnamed protein product [Penicillium salamii]|uniref:Uncharacterized protein n=1 Tax=Penicillium salamii TaxID=1612424 RepID=A0A9W4J9A6_9EURO|nr:unnamed protein product [Penicillium salamii]
MSGLLPPDIPTMTRGLREVCEFEGRRFYRKKGTQEWTEDKSDPESTMPPAEFPHLYLYLVTEEQGPGEAESMKYEPSAEKVNVFDAGITSNVYTLAVVSEEQARAAKLVKQIAEQEPPPRAKDRKSVTENCQSWTMRVIARLVKEGIVMSQKLEVARSMLQPV